MDTPCAINMYNTIVAITIILCKKTSEKRNDYDNMSGIIFEQYILALKEIYQITLHCRGKSNQISDLVPTKYLIIQLGKYVHLSTFFSVRFSFDL
ncbi:hypothetical protein BLOT_005528 [Blomia tropicalis]|nr:hypothetical protein BLOT_005528 [Blomia tropicalis]